MTTEQTVLAIDTSHHVAVGLARGPQVLASRVVTDSRAHVEQLTPSVRSVLDEAGLGLSEVDLVVIGMGPGPFTGLRVGIVTGWTLASTAGIARHEICSLDVVAAQWGDTECGEGRAEEYVVCSDARRKELYWAQYRGAERIVGPQVSLPSELPDLPTVGPGVEHYADELGDRVVDGPRHLDPAVMAVVGPQLAAAGSEPLYLRRPDAAEPKGRKSALPTGPRLLRGLSPRAPQ
ncbi:MAG TPA: tRNA (adenosine(37)-N6)-threonylcarbamoyltransferase complex dimerization subunit type 1 TsaB [Candidatus Avipropionibacterium avicola]|uniref:tRNA (Adenosine(37)-N6)-threonylcarbamoyltransferase complex dimerization subunit type 1 TsaB n=1 Tax=Candidatus Avipropionibacterium avicola TaxID=2840701 RepID=A0A9D1H1V5_9ACTN|nr:tRNA (adenosine(37)-N6)-threonylcarbamoyltransferase complex dimerization subunit type 1 TsaB [Candidatus Avipropionibacterium avicola]